MKELRTKMNLAAAADHAEVGMRLLEADFQGLGIDLVPARHQRDECVGGERILRDLFHEVAAVQRCSERKQLGTRELVAIIHHGNVKSGGLGLESEGLADMTAADDEQDGRGCHEFGQRVDPCFTGESGEAAGSLLLEDTPKILDRGKAAERVDGRLVEPTNRHNDRPVGDRIPRTKTSRLEPLNRSSRREEALTSFAGNRMSLLTSAATRFMVDSTNTSVLCDGNSGSSVD